MLAAPTYTADLAEELQVAGIRGIDQKLILSETTLEQSNLMPETKGANAVVDELTNRQVVTLMACFVGGVLLTTARAMQLGSGHQGHSAGGGRGGGSSPRRF